MWCAAASAQAASSNGEWEGIFPSTAYMGGPEQRARVQVARQFPPGGTPLLLRRISLRIPHQCGCGG